MRKVLLPVLLLALLSLTSCQSGYYNSVSGNGTVVLAERSGLGDFDSIDLAGGMHLDIEVGGPTSVSVETDSNLQDLIQTRVKDGVLRIDHEGSISPSKTIQVTISTPALKSIEVSGGVRVDVRGVDSESFLIDCAGSIGGVVQGRATKCTVDGAGSLSLDLTQLAVQDMQLDVAGSCDLKVAVEKSLDVDVSGSCSVGYIGDPRLTLDQSGSSRIYSID